MKAIINGFRYNTETSERIGINHNGMHPGDFRLCIETLYRTKNDAYFLRGEGGARSEYAKEVSGGWGYGEAIVPLTHQETFIWLSQNGFPDSAEELFPELIEDA